MLNILGGTLTPSSILTYNFELTLSQIGRAPAKSTMVVQVSNNSFPTVTTSFDARYDISGTAKMNDDDRLMVQGLSDVLSTAFVWSAEKLQGAPRGVTLLGLTSAPLVILANAFQPDTLKQGAFITVNLKGSDLRGAKGESSLSVLVNRLPTSGACQACLQGEGACVVAGRALVTNFLMTCSQWVDDDQPMLSQYGVQDSGGLS